MNVSFYVHFIFIFSGVPKMPPKKAASTKTPKSGPGSVASAADPPPIVYERSKYLASTPDQVKKKLVTYGVAVVPNVLDDHSIEEIRRGTWDTLEHITSRFPTPVHRDRPETWKHVLDLYPLHSMLFQHWEMGHAQYVWNVRQNPNVCQVFADLWRVQPEDLAVSFDGVAIQLPPETANPTRGWYRHHSWLHTDQSPTRSGFECVQGWVTAYDVNEGDATLAVLEGSHVYHTEFGKRFGITDPNDWFKLQNDEQCDFYIREHGCPYRAISCNAGSLVLWDSRTIHQGQQACKYRTVPNIRSIVYVCYQPKTNASASEDAFEKKRNAFLDKRMTSHWPLKVTLFNKMPHLYGKPPPDCPPMPPPILTRLGRSLACLPPP